MGFNDHRELQSPSRVAPARVWLERGLLLALLLGAGVALSANTADADLWGHILFGLETLAAGAPQTTTTHSFTASGHPWVNHENVSEVCLAFIHHIGGGRGLLLAKSALGLLVVSSMIWAARRRRVGLTAIWLVVLVVAVNLTAGWSLRPQLFTYTALAGMVLMLDAAFARWESDGVVRFAWLWMCVPLMLLWTNAHGGFLAGYGLLVLYLGVRALQAGLRLGLAAWPLVLRFGAVVGMTALATLINPYGPLLHRWLFGAMSQPPAEITEWASLTPANNLFWPGVFLLALTGSSLILSSRRRDPAQVLLIVVAGCQAVSHVRHVALLAILVGYWIPLHCDSMLARWPGRSALKSELETEVRMSRWALAFYGISLAAVCVALGGVLTSRIAQLRVDREQFPVSAVQFMAHSKLKGRLLATYNWAEYAMAALPDSPVSFDGRFDTCYPPHVLDAHFDFVLGDAPGLRTRPRRDPTSERMALELGKPELALVDRRQPNSVRILANHPDWALLYQDSVAQVWGRRDRFDDPKSPDYLSPARRRITDDPQQGYAVWPALPQLSQKNGRRGNGFAPLRVSLPGGAT
jgi:hypothetical protein